MLIAPSKFRSRAMIVLRVTIDPGAQKTTIAPLSESRRSVGDSAKGRENERELTSVASKTVFPA